MSRSVLDGIAQCLVESAKAFVNDQNEKNKIRYQMQLVNGIRSRLQENGIDALYEEEFMETIKKMLDMMQNPVSTESTREVS